MEDLSQLKSNPKVLEIYQNRISLKKESGNWVGKCPFHSEKTGSFVVNNKSGQWLFKCFGCDAGGSIVDFVQKLDNCSISDAIKTIRGEISGWSNSKKNVDSAFKPVGGEKKKITGTLGEYRVLEENLEKSQEAKDFLESRGISIETARKLHFGFRIKLGSKHSDTDDKGWISLPILDGDVVRGVKYRSISRKTFTHELNMSGGIFNIDSIDAFSPIVITEGEFDCATFEQSGFHCISLPSASAKLTPEEKDRIMQAAYIILAGDMDAPGQEVMRRLWADFKSETYLLQWPKGIKDANEFLLNVCNKDPETFKQKINELVEKAKGTPMPGVVSIQEAMMNANRVNLEDDPNRFRFPWKSVDRMVNLMPGSMLCIFATNTGMGKTTFTMNALLYAALRGEVVLNYSAELSHDEYANLITAHVLSKHRNELTKKDYENAAKNLAGIRFYNGRNPVLTTTGQVIDLIEDAVRRLSITVVCIDHIHFICRNESNPVQAMENAMQRLKNLTVEYGLKTVVVGQPRKAKQESRGHRVHITDAKGSESFSSDADAVISLHREVVKGFDPSNPPKEPYLPETEISLLKGRSQGSGAAFTKLMFMGEFASFHEMTSQFDEKPKDVFF